MADLSWGPYRSQAEARQCIGRFCDALMDPGCGVIWSSGDDAVWLRPPRYDREGYGTTLLARHDGVEAPPPIQAQPTTFLGRIIDELGRQSIKAAERSNADAAVQARMLRENVITPLNDFISRYEYVKDGISFALDVAGVIAGVAAGFTLIAVGGTFAVVVGLTLGIVSGVACLALAAEDGYHAWFTLNGDQAGKAELEATGHYRWVEAVGPLLALPDLAVSGRAALRELSEASAIADRAARTTSAAGGRSEQAARQVREMVGDSDQYAPELARVADSAASQSARYQRMQDITRRANLRLIVARDAVAAYGGTLWSSGLYAYDPPDLAKLAASRVADVIPSGHPPPPVGSTPNAIAPGGNVPNYMLPQPTTPKPSLSTARVSLTPGDNPWGLLEPPNSRTCVAAPHARLQLTAVASTRPVAKRKK